MRNYELMRQILIKTSHECRGEYKTLGAQELEEIIKGSTYSPKDAVAEVRRLTVEELINSETVFDAFSKTTQVKVEGITEKGEEFLRLIEEPKVWEICLKTLKDAGLDLSYPFLKEVCEEIVKRYVMGKIPKDL